MNWEAIKNIYRCVFIWNSKIEYLGGDKYKLISFYASGEKHSEVEYKNELLHGKCIIWHENGQKWWEREYQNDQLCGKNIKWHENGDKCWETKYQNGKQIK